MKTYENITGILILTCVIVLLILFIVKSKDKFTIVALTIITTMLSELLILAIVK